MTHLYSNTVLQDGLSGIDGDLVVGGISVLQSQVVVPSEEGAARNQQPILIVFSTVIVGPTQREVQWIGTVRWI